MTLIVSVLTPDVVFQVSDRRLILTAQDGTRQPSEEVATKAVVFCNRAVFGYTGDAVVDGKPTNEWIADQLKNVNDLGVGLEKMRSRLDKIHFRLTHGLTICAVGFRRELDGSATRYFAMVTNHMQDGEFVSTPQRRFESRVLPLAPSQGGRIVPMPPGWLTRERIERLVADVQAASTGAAIELVADAIREVASTDMAVGEDLMVSVLPKATAFDVPASLSSGGVGFGGSPTFYYLPADGAPVAYSPTWVCGSSSVSGLAITYVAPDAPESGSADQGGSQPPPAVDGHGALER